MSAAFCLPGCYPLRITFSLAHWHPNGTSHGAKSNPTWVAASYVKLSGNAYSMWGTDAVARFPRLLDMRIGTGRRLWVYFHGGYAWHCDIYVDERNRDLERRVMAA